MAKYLDKIGLSYFWSLIKSKLIPAGGQQGQVLAKASSADDDVTWVSTGVNNLIGDNLVAASNRQIVIGQYNEADSDENAIIVGNGTDDTDRQNTFKVSRDGDIDTAGGISYNGDLTVGGVSFIESAVQKALNCRSDSYGWVTYDHFADSRRMIQMGARVDNTASSAYGHNVSLYASSDGLNLYDSNVPADIWRLLIPNETTNLGVSTVGIGTGITKGSACSSCNAFLRKTGHVVQLAVHTIKLTGNLAAGASSGTILTLPVGYRPPIEILAPWASSGNTHGYLSLKSNGTLNIHNSSSTAHSTSMAAYINVTYII